ncbi:hypothetical protein [Serratia sp. D1N4]
MAEEKKSSSLDELMKEIVSHATELSKVDFEKLESEGIIEKVRGGYLVKKYTLLPEIARRLIKSMKQTKNGVKIIISKPPKSFLDLAKK